MCGIAGRVNRERPPDATQLDAMSALVAHRGPDGAGRYIDARAALAHRRLAVVDRAGGAQPVFGEGPEGARVVLVYNGEVYNHEVLRRPLEARGHRFGSRCDTEAVLHAHEEWGTDAPGRLRGMFAYAAWDPVRGELTLVRDRLGIKPLFYAHLRSGDLLFSSELKALLVEPEVDRHIDEDALDAYLALRFVPAPATLLRGVRKLPPGTILTWRDGHVEVRRYWVPPTGPVAERPPPPPTEAEAAGRLAELLDEAIALRRMGEVPVGAFLSGGLDSSLVAATLARLARRAGDEPPHTFSIGWTDSAGGDDERGFAERVARAIGARHHSVGLSGAEVAARAGEIAWSLDEPIADPAAAPLWFLSRRAREHVTVILSGEGADEVFAGYAIHRRALLGARVAQLPGASAAAAVLAARLPPGPLRRALGLVVGSPIDRYRGVARAFDDSERPPWGAPGGLERLLGPARAHASGAASSLLGLLAVDLAVWLPDDLLAKADKVTMAHALELRVPLLDHVLVEEVAGWPDGWKIAGGVGKAILRRAAEGLVPPEVLGRRKMGFSTPIAAWLRGPLRGLARDLLLSSRSLAAERSGRAAVVRLLLEHERRAHDRSSELWALVALELWRTEVLWRVAARPEEHGARRTITG